MTLIRKIKRKIKHICYHIKLLSHSNSAWLIFFWMLYEGSQALDKDLISQYPFLKTWLPVFICFVGIWYKIYQNIQLNPDYYDFNKPECKDRKSSDNPQ